MIAKRVMDFIEMVVVCIYSDKLNLIEGSPIWIKGWFWRSFREKKSNFKAQLPVGFLDLAFSFDDTK